MSGFPPTTTKGSGDSAPVITFQIAAPNIPITHSGSIATIGTIPTAGGGTNVTSAGASGNLLTSNGTNWVSSAPIFTGARYNASSSSLSGVYAKVTYTSKDWDVDNVYASGTYTVPAARVGYYRVKASIQIDCASVAVGNSNRLAIYYNGVIRSENISTFASTATLGLEVQVDDEIHAPNANDTIEIFALSSGATPTISAVPARVYVNFQYLGA